MKELARLRPYLWQRRGTLAVAYACMALLAAATAALAALSGPALRALFAGAQAGAGPALGGGALAGVGDRARLGAGLGARALQALPAWCSPQALHAAASNLGPWTVPVAIVAVAVLKGLAQSGQFYALGRVSLHVQQSLRRDAFAALLAQPPSFFARHRQGDLLSRLLHDVTLVEQGVFYGLGSVVRDSLALVALLGYCLATDAKLACGLLLGGPLVALPLRHFSRRLKRFVVAGQSAQGELANCCHEALQGLVVVQSCQQEDHERARLQRAEHALMRQLTRSYLVRALRTPTMEILGAVAIAALLGALSQAVHERGVDAAHYVSFFAALLLMYDPIKKLGNVADYLAQAEGALQRLLAVLDAPRAPQTPQPTAAAAAPDADAPAPAAARRSAGRARGRPAEADVTFEAVDFAYGARPVLQGVQLHVPQGAQVAVVGASGAGKSTLAHLLPRFWDVTGGALRVGGRDVRDVPLQALRGAMALVGQETFLFAASVADNIAYGRAGASRDEVVAAAKAAFAHDFIVALPHGYDTQVGERGAGLSGGQRQRVAVARAVLRRAPILILDEATSSLDADSEAKVQAALTPLMQRCTTLVVAHRLQTVRHADSIAVLAGGRIVEQGDHPSLLRRNGAYAELLRVADAAPPPPQAQRPQAPRPQSPAGRQTPATEVFS